ncbi:hypothetical protein NDU88_005776 [Pleurodeles waltl]|uniref:Uncharacterized protein n=1 Tax=Pleurodeles waltl TaxID=8319 RepID=A0AAV7QGQ7_PLEWA|nr:hypothetical protein NDU88_005776 [Pleurodeles waltl]
MSGDGGGETEETPGALLSRDSAPHLALRSRQPGGRRKRCRVLARPGPSVGLQRGSRTESRSTGAEPRRGPRERFPPITAVLCIPGSGDPLKRSQENSCNAKKTVRPAMR